MTAALMRAAIRAGELPAVYSPPGYVQVAILHADLMAWPSKWPTTKASA